jgi:hypothetical protein
LYKYVTAAYNTAAAPTHSFICVATPTAHLDNVELLFVGLGGAVVLDDVPEVVLTKVQQQPHLSAINHSNHNKNKIDVLVFKT